MAIKTVPESKITLSNWLRVSLQRIGVVHFVLVGAYLAQIIFYDSTKVITPDVVLWRWIAIGCLSTICIIVWYLAHNQNNDVATYKRLTFLIISADIAFASFNVYSQRGMASRAVLLYVVAIASSAILLSRAALYTTAVISSIAYSLTAVSYFTLNFNEGYKAELYGEVVFYSFVFVVLAMILSAVVRFGGDTANS